MKRKTLTTALLAGLTGTVGIVNVSNAVNLNQDGLGGALIYPYYTVRDGMSTIITVVNTTAQAKAVKVRFLEAYNSREVLDFNLYMSPFDVWTASVIDNGTGGAIFSTDSTCTVPDVPSSPAQAVPFRNIRFDDPFNPNTGNGTNFGAPTGLDRTREGHVELLEMGVLHDLPTAGGGTLPIASASASKFCDFYVAMWNADILGLWTPGGRFGPNLGVSEPTGGLFGGGMLVDVTEGWIAEYNARAIAEWSATPQQYRPGSVQPNFRKTNTSQQVGAPVTTRVFYQGQVITSKWNKGAKAISALFMHDAIYNTYVLDAITQSGTDWVVTFPTKRFHTDPLLVGTNPIPPFTTYFFGTACEPVGLAIYNRDELTTTQDLDFSPQPEGKTNVLCFETNVLTFRDSSVLGSPLDTFTNVPAPFDHGWLKVNLAMTGSGHSMTSMDGDTYFGLPATGFAVQTFVNGTLTGPQGNTVLSVYAATFAHRYSRDIVSGGQPN